jgi:hypothetical protein
LRFLFAGYMCVQLPTSNAFIGRGLLVLSH